MPVLATLREPPNLRLRLNRPEVHNALDRELIEALDQALAAAAEDPHVRVVILEAEGRSFCAGGDLTMLAAAIDAGADAAEAEALALGRMLRRLYELPKPTVARVQGAALGGGMGLVAACDIVVAAEGARFGFTEVRLGLVPAVISPLVLRRVPPGVARRLFVTGERFDALLARDLGLVDEVVPPETLDDTIQRRLAALMDNGPEAVAACKRLVDRLAPINWDETLPLAARWLADRRLSAEGQEGMRAFLERRAPHWVNR